MVKIYYNIVHFASNHLFSGLLPPPLPAHHPILWFSPFPDPTHSNTPSEYEKKILLPLMVLVKKYESSEGEEWANYYDPKRKRQFAMDNPSSSKKI